jgi:4-phospho-D-threonate 3-dehydrogenase / 4-phospho-D-erythronate 3-dehydrogenase
MAGARKSVVGVTMGDPAGIGAEIVAKMLASSDLRQRADAVVIGSAEVMRRTVKHLALPLKIVEVNKLPAGAVPADAILVYDTHEVDVSSVAPGSMGEVQGKASMCYNRQGAELAQAGLIDALLTSPVTKFSAKKAGFNYAGQAEYFAELAGNVEFITILIYKQFKAALLTTHHSLLEACQLVTKDRVLHQLQFLHDRRASLGHDKLTIGVAALNPHGGESGTMGMEEITDIAPAIEEARKRGILAEGPFPVNALISPPYDGRNFGMTLAMYHDQVVARMNMHETTTVTFGLPFIRTSVGHGSALDIAGKGIADETALRISMLHTIELAEARIRLQA